ncbi:hypothetical protein [Streptomyces sp. NPDC090994]|uniref:hypothetical protein n=1 Tax=Streptomyces sp. NPDC090994 TaxID=3365969 RepID=UPI0038260983
MVRRSQSSNPRSVVVLTSGADWGTRAAGQRRSSGAESPIPRRQPAKIKALQQTIGIARTAINNKRWHQARYALSRARALANALPGNVAVQEREHLSALRKKYAARNTPATKNAKQAKPAPARRTKVKKRTTQKPKPAPVRELGDRFISRAALGYEPTDKA